MKVWKAEPEPRVEETASCALQGPNAELGRDIRATIGRQLRARYDDVVEQGVPARFAELLNQLDAVRPTGHMPLHAKLPSN